MTGSWITPGWMDPIAELMVVLPQGVPRVEGRGSRVEGRGSRGSTLEAEGSTEAVK